MSDHQKLRYVPLIVLVAVLASVVFELWSSGRDVRRVDRFERNLCQQVNLGRKNTKVRNAVVKTLGGIMAQFLESARKVRANSAPNEPNGKLRGSDLNAAHEYKRLRDRAREAVSRLHASPAVNCGSP